MSEPAAVTRARQRAAATGGAVAAGVALGVSELLSGLSRHTPSLVVSVGDLVVDYAPFGLVEGAIAIFGTNDKQALVIGTAVLALAFGGLLGKASLARPRVGHVGFELFGLLGVFAASRQHDASTLLSLVTALFAVAAGIATLDLLGWAGRDERSAESGERGVDRRAFLGLAAAGALVGSAAAAGGSRLRHRFRVDAARAAVRLPAPTQRVADVRPGAISGIEGLSPLLTPNDRFYRIDTAILVPQVEPETWSLKVGGRVEEPYELSYGELLDLPMVEEYVTLACVSNEIGGSLVGTAKWLGVPLADVIERARPQRGAEQIVGRSVDRFTVGFPAEAATDGRTALIAVGMNGEPLPIRHGFPARLVVSGLYGYVSATKWLSEIELTGWEDFDAYWVPRGWSKEAPVKTQSRIDAPRGGRSLPEGATAVAGVAWAPHRGISKVELSIDGDDWQPARLSGETPVAMWRQWSYEWDATAGDHSIAVRATDGEGAVQTADRAPPPPDGATGHHTIHVRVASAT